MWYEKLVSSLNDWSLIITPAAVVTGGCIVGWLRSPGKDPHKRSSFQPPGWVFGVVWPTLYTSIGYVLAKSNFETAIVVNVIANYSWPFVFSWDTRLAAMLLGAMAGQTTWLASRHTLLIPYSLWLWFALLLNLDVASKPDNPKSRA